MTPQYLAIKDGRNVSRSGTTARRLPLFWVLISIFTYFDNVEVTNILEKSFRNTVVVLSVYTPSENRRKWHQPVLF